MADGRICSQAIFENLWYNKSSNYKISREKFEPEPGFAPPVQFFLLRSYNINFPRPKLWVCCQLIIWKSSIIKHVVDYSPEELSLRFSLTWQKKIGLPLLDNIPWNFRTAYFNFVVTLRVRYKNRQVWWQHNNGSIYVQVSRRITNTEKMKVAR